MTMMMKQKTMTMRITGKTDNDDDNEVGRQQAIDWEKDDKKADDKDEGKEDNDNDDDNEVGCQEEID